MIIKEIHFTERKPQIPNSGDKRSKSNKPKMRGKHSQAGQFEVPGSAEASRGSDRGSGTRKMDFQEDSRKNEK